MYIFFLFYLLFISSTSFATSQDVEDISRPNFILDSSHDVQPFNTDERQLNWQDSRSSERSAELPTRRLRSQKKLKRAKKSRDEKFQNYELPPQRDDSAYSASGSNYGIPAASFRRGKHDRVSKDTSSDFGESKQVIAGIPDMSDPCFRRYANCIIVNAQPYERRSSTSLIKCKRHCLQSQLGVYSCRSFVYDNTNQVCDLFAHVGDQPPARLLKFQTRDYFEPTSALQCDLPSSHASTTLPTTAFEREFTPDLQGPNGSNQGGVTSGFRDDPRPQPPAPPPDDLVDPLIETFTEPLTPPAPSDAFHDTTQTPTATPTPVVDTSVKTFFEEEDLSSTEFQTSPSNGPSSTSFAVSASTVGTTQCEAGRIPRFLRTQGFELFNNDDITIAVGDVNECVKMCADNYAGRPIECKSFDYADGHCSFTEEAAVPLGNGQLKQRSDAEYYERICVDEDVTHSCPQVFNRYPQMILVGFAESVNDAPTFEQCFHNCLHSYSLYGFNCSSGMYYFEETQLNCILNSEDRTTQSDLFAEENTDIVDYFEIGCSPRALGVKTQTNIRIHGVKTSNYDSTKVPTKSENLVIADETSTEWTECDDGVQHRRRDCAKMDRSCGLESRACVSEKNTETGRRADVPEMWKRDFKKLNDFAGRTTPQPLTTIWPTTTTVSELITTKPKRKKISISIDRLKKAAKNFERKCKRDVCCAVFGHCEYGLIQNSRTRKLEWCHDPCV